MITMRTCVTVPRELNSRKGKNMNKSQLIDVVAKETELKKKDAELAVNAVFEAIVAGLAEGDKVQILGFGSFEVNERAAREGRNPATGAKITIPASKYPAFSASKALKDRVNK